MIEVFPTPGAPMTAMLSVSTIPRGSGLLTTTTDQDSWKTVQQIKTKSYKLWACAFFVLKLQQSTRTHFVDVEINKSLLTDLLSSGTFRYLFWWNTLLVASVTEWINKPTSFTAAVELSSLHSIGEQSSVLHSIPTHSSGARKRQQYPTVSIWLLSGLCVLFDLEVTIDPFSS